MSSGPTIKQIVLVKGWEGFADRLQILSHCLHYCKLHSAAICVDWRDYMWTHEFSDYFEIVGIPVVILAEVLERYKAGASVLPLAVDFEMLAAEPDEQIHFAEFTSPINNKYERVAADIIVHNGKGLRMWHIDNLICNLRLTRSTADIVSARLAGLESPYTAIHLRGTDRLCNLTLADAIKSAITAFNDQPPHVKARQYVISDMRDLVDLWLVGEPKARQLSTDYAIYKLPAGTQGTHQLPAIALDFYGVNKHTMNIDTITDFLIICFANWSFGNSKESTYTRMAAFMRQGGKKGVARWLHGFEPKATPFEPKATPFEPKATPFEPLNTS